MDNAFASECLNLASYSSWSFQETIGVCERCLGVSILLERNPQLRQIIKGIYKESVELTSVYLNEGCGKTL